MTFKPVGADENGLFPTRVEKRIAPVFNVKGFGALGNGAADDRASIQAAIVAAEIAGGRVLFPQGTYLLNSGGSLKLQPNNAGTRGWVDIQFGPGASLKLSASCPRAFEFQRLADYDTFRKVRISDATIDADNVNGNKDSVIGNWVGGVHPQRVSYEDIELVDLHIFNLPSTLANVGAPLRPHIWLDSNEPGPPWPGPTQCTMNRIKIIRPRLFGGDSGIMINATPASASSPTGTNNYSDNILIEDALVELNSGAAPAGFLPQSGIIMGGSGTGGKARVVRPVVKYSGDVGIEIDAFQDAVIDTPETTNCKIGVYLNNFHSAIDVTQQVTKIIRPRHTVTSAWTGQYSNGIKLGFSNPYGKLIIRDQEYYCTSQTWSTFGSTFIGMATSVLGDILEVDVDGLTARATSLVIDASSTQSISLLDLGSTHTDAKLKAKNLDGYVSYTRTGSTAGNCRVFAFRATDAVVNIGPGVSWEVSSPSGDNFTTYGVALGEAASGISTSIFRGYVVGLTPRAMTGDTNPRGLRFFAGSGAGTIIAGNNFPVMFCDFSKLSGGAAENDIFWADTATRAKLKMGGNVYRATTNLPHEGSTSWDPASVASGASVSTTVTVTGAAIGDMVLPTLSVAVPAGVILTANVTAADTATVTLSNLSGGAVDLANSTLRVRRLVNLV